MKTPLPHLIFAKSGYFCLLVVLIHFSQDTHAQELADYQWSNRILVLVDTDHRSKALQSQLRLLQESSDDLVDRDLIIFLVDNTQIRNAKGEPIPMDREKVLKTIQVKNDFSGVVLIGKDGGVKFKETFQVAPQQVFDLIDSMPMRRSELRNKG
ncbi:DUF4174 domain-containing protein [Flavobacteriaceae bacterium TP-CH-4]|uniref:DUF4174 domain-containing protein n=1 Tax=Pelagihabitans pacificus TaxID=2696054 RepID=A0A967B0B5_9FLAO|nr:DUF4174 domain-containing protein [Pelagihabitans pacificus]NHF60792.1 DUF4174 domain-containing protein [Pelagihabitans pacificus]